ncbi:universal stress protein [Gordonia rhizosphera]|uniref:Usp family protein n=1 Tax=Gordonia rhizosphera NBRC 16068 TaxID=1108045 RepID=K6WAU6_9ACTN|nr:universal stress protein [Gordonia rhizosphera]GAB90871.1 Usp family protein [Gordonia rhizosphera NBRC 16068]
MSDSQNAPLIVGIDGSETALGAARWAGALSARTHARVDLVNAVPGDSWYSPLLDEYAMAGDKTLHDQVRELGDAKLEDAARAVREVSPDSEITTTTCTGAFADHIKSHSEGAQMVVIGARVSLRETLGGQVMPIIRAAKCPVLAWREPTADDDAHANRVVVGSDESENADRALLAALNHAHLFGGRVTVAYFQQVSTLIGSAYATTAIDWDRLRRNEAQRLKASIADTCAKFPDVEVEVVYDENAAGRGLNELSRSAGLVVVGSRGRGAVKGMLLGSVSQSLVHHAHCPVLVVP